MCYGNESSPPEHGVGGEVASEEDLVLTSADGTRFQARLARPADPNGKGVVILPDVRGLYSFYCALARKFAEAGIEAIAIDYFGRTAGTDPRPADFDWQSHLRQVDFDKVSVDAAQAIAHLRALGTVTSVFTVGFCFGGSMSWRQSAEQEGLAGAIGFYGAPGRVGAGGTIVPRMKAPLLMLLAGADVVPAEDHAALQEELEQHGIQRRVVTYEGAPHSFFDRTYDEWQEACSDSWRQMFAFMKDPAAA
jgi:carboxymethylenebutenolidase